MWPAVPTTRWLTPCSLPAAARGLLRRALALARSHLALCTPRLGLGRGLASSRSPLVLALANGVEDFGQPEVDLPSLQVHPNHLHAHLLAEPVDLVRVLAVQSVAVFQVAI